MDYRKIEMKIKKETQTLMKCLKCHKEYWAEGSVACSTCPFCKGEGWWTGSSKHTGVTHTGKEGWNRHNGW